MRDRLRHEVGEGDAACLENENSVEALSVDSIHCCGRCDVAQSFVLWELIIGDYVICILLGFASYFKLDLVSFFLVASLRLKPQLLDLFWVSQPANTFC